ncbi:MAG: ATP-binding protein, partial [Candidatus Marinimicrobia bacterium]|nr:ATP-binding protein [Candidatus Neomarinimicrobiota bacterium]
MKYSESQTVELKSSISQLSRSMESLCAFANTDLGTVYFGIANDGKPTGIKITDNTYRKVQEAVFNSFDPKIYPNIFEEETDEKPILVVELKNAPDRPYFVKGKAYKRVGTSNTTLSKVEIERMMYERGNPEFHYDRSPLKSDMNDVDHKRIKWFYRLAHEERNLPLDDTP